MVKKNQGLLVFYSAMTFVLLAVSRDYSGKQVCIIIIYRLVKSLAQYVVQGCYSRCEVLRF